MKTTKLLAIATAGLLATGCDQSGTGGGSSASKPAASTAGAPAIAPVSAEEAVAIVNGKPISKATLQILKAEIGQRRGGASIPDDKIVDELIKRELLRQEAENSGLLKDPELAAKMENATRMALSQAAAEHFIKNVQVNDEVLKKEYEQRIGAMKQSEYKAKHILVEDEKTAKDIIAKLQKGEKFDVLAKKLSKDPGSKDKGGDLGWFNPQQMVPPFSQAVSGLKNGELTATPVQTQFGWHVIQREDSREQQPPAFDSVKDQIKSMLQSQKLQEHLADLQTKAKIENKLPPPPKAPEPAAPAASQAPESAAPAAEAKPAESAPASAKPAGDSPAAKPAEHAEDH
jgi:peptidyl-prolyl cis-trans isomerase C